MQAITQLEHDIICLDAHYVSPGIACFYLLRDADEYAVVETGTSHSVPALLEHLDAEGIEREQVRYIIPTHVHLDHAGGAGAMMAAFPVAQLLIHPRGARHMAEPGRLVESAKAVYGEATFSKLYGDITPIPAARISGIEDGDTVHLGSRALVFRHTRGHANHHMCIWDERSRGWFSGDMFGVSYPWFRFDRGDFLLPATTPTQFDPQAYLESLALLQSYSPRAMYLTHFGEFPYSQSCADLLRKQVTDYCELAGRLGSDPGALELGLGEYTMDLLREYDPTAGEETLRKWVALDMPLNTQGLLHWRG